MLLTLQGTAGCNYIMGIPGADDIMLNYQSTSFHDALYIRNLLKLKPAPEFEVWLNKMKLWNSENFEIQSTSPSHYLLEELKK
jgi:ethanolamine ammonia-lyase large subunit